MLGCADSQDGVAWRGVAYWLAVAVTVLTSFGSRSFKDTVQSHVAAKSQNKLILFFKLQYCGPG